MAIYKTAINKPITTALIFVAIVILGLFSLTRLPIDQFPEILDAAYRRRRILRDEYEVKPRIARMLARLRQFHDPQLFAVDPDHKKIDVGISPIIAFQKLGDGNALLVELLFPKFSADL